MKRIDTPNRELDLFGAGKDGFRNGNLALGVLPTEFNADWPNGIQEELLAIIEAAGLAPDGGVLNQLLQALRATGVFTTAAVNTNTTKAATTAFVRAELLSLGSSVYDALFGRSLTPNGRQWLPGGALIQWLTTPMSSASAPVAFSFPITFPNGIYGYSISLGTGAAANFPGTDTLNNAGGSFSVFNTASARVASNACRIIAIGA